MIVYFADRKFNILGLASTKLQNGLSVISDTRSESIESGLKIFELTVAFDINDRKTAERFTEPGNYLLRSHEDSNEFYTIVESTFNTTAGTVLIYCEDAGMDMINNVCGDFEATSAMTFAQYVAQFASDSGFIIGVNEISNLTRKLAWTGEETASARIRSVATQFDNAELSFSFDIKNMEVVAKYINVYKRRGQDAGVQLRLNREVNNIQIKKSASNIATALLVTGGIPSGKSTPIDLSGYAFDDGDIYSPQNSKYIYSRSALAKWSRKNWESDNGIGDLIRLYTYDTTSQSELATRATAELKKLMDIEVNYEIDINNLGDKNVSIGDTVYIVDELGELYLSARVLQLDESVTSKTTTLTLGEYLLKPAGLSERLEALASQFSSVVSAIDAGTSNQLYVESSAGLVLSDGSSVTTLKVTIYRGSESINSYAELVGSLGSTAYIQWYKLNAETGEYVDIPASASEISENGFKLTVTGEQVGTYRCALMIDGQLGGEQNGL